MRLFLPLLPLPVLAALVAASACSKPRSEETTHVIPPAAPFVLPVAVAQPPPAAAPAPTGPTGAATDDAPSPEEVKAFERPVAK